MREVHGTADAVQRGEELILYIYVRAGETVEQGGFARVGVAHQRHHRHAALFPALAAEGALLLHFRPAPGAGQ